MEIFKFMSLTMIFFYYLRLRMLLKYEYHICIYIHGMIYIIMYILFFCTLYIGMKCVIGMFMMLTCNVLFCWEFSRFSTSLHSFHVSRMSVQFLPGKCNEFFWIAVKWFLFWKYMCSFFFVWSFQKAECWNHKVWKW